MQLRMMESAQGHEIGETGLATISPVPDSITSLVGEYELTGIITRGYSPFAATGAACDEPGRPEGS